MARSNRNTKTLGDFRQEVACEFCNLADALYIAKAAFNAPGFDPATDQNLNAYGLLSLVERCLDTLRIRIETGPERTKLQNSFSGHALTSVNDAKKLIGVLHEYTGSLGSSQAPAIVTVLHTVLKNGHDMCNGLNGEG